MQNLWVETDAAKCNSDVDLRAYSSRLIGQDPAMVLHGGGNTSVKSTQTDAFGDEHDIIWVKASGFDLAKMGPEGFTALELAPLLKLAELGKLSDPDMVNECLRARLDTSAAGASIEAIVHALVPFKYVDHSHADAILTISNSPNGAARFEEIFGDRVLVLPYVKPGFDLARQFKDALNRYRFADYEAVILEHHGIFTYADDAKSAYDAMVDVVREAEQWLIQTYGELHLADRPRLDPVLVARSRKRASQLAGQAVISIPAGAVDAELAAPIGAMLRRGTLTPEHVIHNKPFPAMLAADGSGFEAFDNEYRAYFDRADDDNLTLLPTHPHWAIFAGGQSRSYGINLKRASISADVATTTLRAMLYAQKLGGWQGLSEGDLRDLEYWELEQAKLKRQKLGPQLTGKIAVVTGAASGIGAATARALEAAGAVVVGLDLNPAVAEAMNRPGYEGRVVDLTDETALAKVLADTVESYGGLDILVLNAGVFKSGDWIENLPDDVWDASIAVNLNAHRKALALAIPYLRHGIDPAVVFMGSRNVTAPGAGAAAYSVAKAGLTQLMRVAALELAPEGIRVNAIHPDAVFDTNLWTNEALEKSAARYGLTVDEYKTRNLLKIEIGSADVARAVVALADRTFRATTGAQIPLDGGNDRVI
jgi:rhamnose utilization protein RhaD (predicted bifunctional aldolase and dehydrogenase)/NAD(P)-dependent dehydrogenase (short-subunit alcohol dehydrogenase family)